MIGNKQNNLKFSKDAYYKFAADVYNYRNCLVFIEGPIIHGSIVINEIFKHAINLYNKVKLEF